MRGTSDSRAVPRDIASLILSQWKSSCDKPLVLKAAVVAESLRGTTLFFWNLALPNQCLGRNPGPTNPFDGKRHRQSKITPNTAILQPFSSSLSSSHMTFLKLFNLNHRKRNNWKYKSLRRWNNNLGTSTLGAICGHLIGYGGLCERISEFNEAHVEYWSDSSLCAHIENASLKSLLGACDLLCWVPTY